MEYNELEIEHHTSSYKAASSKMLQLKPKTQIPEVQKVNDLQENKMITLEPGVRLERKW